MFRIKNIVKKRLFSTQLYRNTQELHSKYNINKNYSETVEWIYSNTPINRINFFI